MCFKNFDEIALSCTVKDTGAIWCFALFVTNLKIDNDPNFWEGEFLWGKLGRVRVVCLYTQRNGCHFWRVKYSLKLGKASLHRYLVSQTVCRICCIWHGCRDTGIFVFCNFCEKFKMAAFFGTKMFENWVSYSAVTLRVKNFVNIALMV